MSVGQRLKELRGGMSQIDFAKQFGVTSSTISGIEAGKSIPSVELATRICEMYNCSLDWLLRGIGEKETAKVQPVTPALDIDLMTKYLKVLEENSELQKRLNKEQEKEIEKLQAANSGVQTPQ